MKSTKSLVLVIILVVALIGVFFLRGVMGSGIERVGFIVSGFFDQTFDYRHFSKLRLENQQLKFELEKVRENPSLIRDYRYESALVYSRYPLNDKKTVAINLGSRDGIEEGNPVLTEEKFLFGEVVSVENHQAEVRTLFDSDWKSSVAVGNFNNKAVLHGGSSPNLSLLPKEANVEVGDYIFNTADRFPLFQLIGTLDEIQSNESDLWNEASVQIPYEIEEIESLLVITDFP